MKPNGKFRSKTNLLRLAAPLLIVGCAGCHGPAEVSPVAIRQAESLSPGDIEARKYLFEAQAGKDQVVVFRSEKYWNAKLTDRIDMISNQRNQKLTFPVLIFDRTFFSQFTGVPQRGYLFKMPTTEWDVNESLRSSGGNLGNMTFVFQDDIRTSNEIKIVLSIFTESYEKAKRDVPNLSPDEPNGNWTYNAPTLINGQPVPAPRK